MELKHCIRHQTRLPVLNFIFPVLCLLLYWPNISLLQRNHIFKSSNLRQTYLLGIEDDLGELTSLCKALDDFVGHVGPQVDTESQGGIHCLHQVTQFL